MKINDQINESMYARVRHADDGDQSEREVEFQGDRREVEYQGRWFGFWTRDPDEWNDRDWGVRLGPITAWASHTIGAAAAVHLEPFMWGVPTAWIQISIPFAHVRLTIVPNLGDWK